MTLNLSTRQSRKHNAVRIGKYSQGCQLSLPIPCLVIKSFVVATFSSLVFFLLVTRERSAVCLDLYAVFLGGITKLLAIIDVCFQAALAVRLSQKFGPEIFLDADRLYKLPILRRDDQFGDVGCLFILTKGVGSCASLATLKFHEFFVHPFWDGELVQVENIALATASDPAAPIEVLSQIRTDPQASLLFLHDLFPLTLVIQVVHDAHSVFISVRATFLELVELWLLFGHFQPALEVHALFSHRTMKSIRKEKHCWSIAWKVVRICIDCGLRRPDRKGFPRNSQNTMETKMTLRPKATDASPRQPCKACNGQGSHRSSVSGRYIKCPRCNGTGVTPRNYTTK